MKGRNPGIHLITEWLAQSGDTTFWSWIITAFYIITVGIAFFYLYRIRTDKDRYFFWKCITAFLFMMGINKQLDIQILIVMIGRFVATHLGLLVYKNIIYHLVAAGLLVLFVTAGIYLAARAGRIVLQSLPSVSGVLILMLFVILRAEGISVSRIHGLELLGLGLIFLELLGRVIALLRNGTEKE